MDNMSPTTWHEIAFEAIGVRPCGEHLHSPQADLVWQVACAACQGTGSRGCSGLPDVEPDGGFGHAEASSGVCLNDLG